MQALRNKRGRQAIGRACGESQARSVFRVFDVRYFLAKQVMPVGEVFELCSLVFRDAGEFKAKTLWVFDIRVDHHQDRVDAFVRLAEEGIDGRVG